MPSFASSLYNYLFILYFYLQSQLFWITDDMKCCYSREFAATKRTSKNVVMKRTHATRCILQNRKGKIVKQNVKWVKHKCNWKSNSRQKSFNAIHGEFGAIKHWPYNTRKHRHLPCLTATIVKSISLLHVILFHNVLCNHVGAINRFSIYLLHGDSFYQLLIIHDWKTAHGLTPYP